MKKIMRKFVSLLVVSLLILSLCGCTMESAKSTHATWNKERNIEWQGKEYMLLASVDEGLCPEVDYETSVFVTEADVPTLLQYMLGEHMDVSVDEKFLIGWEFVYCRSDCYEDMATTLEQGSEMNGYCYEYWEESEISEFYTLDENQVNIINDIFTKTIPVEMEYDELYSDAWEYLGDVQSCSEDMLFRIFAFEVWFLDGNYHLVIPDENYEQAYRFEVPVEQMDAVKEIFEKLALYYAI